MRLAPRRRAPALTLCIYLNAYIAANAARADEFDPHDPPLRATHA